MKKATRRAIFITVCALVCLGIALFILINASQATAGIGPNGFAFYARQGINHGISISYGGLKNSPYTVRCQDHPNYQTLADNVTCQIRLKP